MKRIKVFIISQENTKQIVILQFAENIELRILSIEADKYVFNRLGMNRTYIFHGFIIIFGKFGSLIDFYSHFLCGCFFF